MTPRKARPVALAAAVLAAFGCSSRPPPLPARPEGAPLLEVGGQAKGEPVRLGEADLARLPQRKVKGTDPHSGRTAEWEGADLAALVARVRARPGSDTITLRAADGTVVPLNFSTVQQYRPVLALRADGQPLSPMRLAWPNVDQPGLVRDPRHGPWWVTAPVAVEIAPWPRAFGRALAVPPGSPEGARPGGGLFVQRCVFCHEVRGVGGKRGPSLGTWAERHDRAALSKVLAAHPGRFPQDLEADFVPPLHAYLTTMAKAPPLTPLPEGAEERQRERDRRRPPREGGEPEEGDPPGTDDDLDDPPPEGKR